MGLSFSPSLCKRYSKSASFIHKKKHRALLPLHYHDSINSTHDQTFENKGTTTITTTTVTILFHIHHPLEQNTRSGKFCVLFVVVNSVGSLMDRGDSNQPRLIGDYILGPRIGSGSFAVVRRSRHRQLGIEVAVKEIDKKQLSPKVTENLFKEISILSTINHPNIIRLFEAIEVIIRVFLFFTFRNLILFYLNSYI